MIIGLTGTMGSGKAEVAKYLARKGFEHFVYSDILREIAEQRDINPTRINLQKLGNEIKKKANGILSKKISRKIKKENAVVDGIRNMDEIREFRKRKDFYLIAITAPQRIRYERIRKREREGDPTSFKDFKKLDNKENRGKTKGQEINRCIRASDFVIANKGSLQQLKKKVDKILASFE